MKCSESLSFVAIHWQLGTGGHVVEGRDQNGQIQKLEWIQKRPSNNFFFNFLGNFLHNLFCPERHRENEVSKNSWRGRLHFYTSFMLPSCPSVGCTRSDRLFFMLSSGTCLLGMKNHLSLRKVIFWAHKTKRGAWTNQKNQMAEEISPKIRNSWL